MGGQYLLQVFYFIILTKYSGKFVITNETYLFDFSSMKWKKINFKQGFIPS
jgi:hypothetical protein